MQGGRRGFAVLFALFAIMLFGGIAAAMVFAAGAETLASGSMLASSQALSAVESAVWSTVSSFDWSSALTFLPGQSASVSLVTGLSKVDVSVVRLDSTCFLVQGVGGGKPNGARNPRFLRRVGVTIEVTRDSAGQVRASKVPNRAWAELFQP